MLKLPWAKASLKKVDVFLGMSIAIFYQICMYVCITISKYEQAYETVILITITSVALRSSLRSENKAMLDLA